MECWNFLSGTLVWRIRNFSAKLKEAKAKEGVELISSAFYTGQYGFKIQVILKKQKL